MHPEDDPAHGSRARFAAPSRRSLVRAGTTAAWTVPLVTVAAAAPALAAASSSPTLTVTSASFTWTTGSDPTYRGLSNLPCLVPWVTVHNNGSGGASGLILVFFFDSTYVGPFNNKVAPDIMNSPVGWQVTKQEPGQGSQMAVVNTLATTLGASQSITIGGPVAAHSYALLFKNSSSASVTTFAKANNYPYTEPAWPTTTPTQPPPTVTPA